MKHTYTNTSDQYQIVGNLKDLISSHATAEEANQALEADLPEPWSIEDSPWALISVIGPGETRSAHFMEGLSEGQLKESERSFEQWFNRQIE